MKKKSNGDKIMQTEILIELLNTRLAKNTVLNNKEAVKKLEQLRHQIYCEDFDYETILKEIDNL